MKKTMILGAAALAATMAMGVESSVVGYLAYPTTANKQDIGAVQFEGANGTSLNLQKMRLGDGYTSGVDNVRFYNPSSKSYVMAFYFDDGIYADATAEEPMAESGWGDAGQTVINLDVDAGTGFWVKTEKTSSVIVPGALASSDENAVETPANTQNLVGSPYPMSVSLQKIAMGDGATSGVDNIRVYNGSGYTMAFYFTDGIYADATAEEPMAETGWGDAGQTAIDLTIKAGQGFWTKTEKESSLVFPAP